MQVDNVTSTNQDPKKPQAAGLAKSALGWINRVISDSVQEISDFSAMLSAQTEATQAKATPDKSKVIDLIATPESDVVTATKANAKTAKSKAAKSENNQTSADSASEPTEDETAAVPQETSATETKAAAAESSSNETAANADQSPNTLVAELVASQLQTNSKSAETEEPKTAAAVAEVAVSADKVPTTEAANIEKMPTAVEKDLVDFAGVSAKKAQAAEANAPVANVDNSKTKETVANVSSRDESKPQDVSFDLVGQQSPVVNSQITKSAQSSTSAAALGLTQSFLSTWTSGASVASEGRQDETIRSGIEALNGAKQSHNLNKAQTDINSSAGMQAKVSDIAALSDKALSFSLGSNGSEQGQKSESSKSSKPLTRSQSLATLDRVEAALQKASESKDGTQISLRLDPPNLGSVKVDVSFKEGSLHARISADSAQVLQLLRDKAPELQVVLRKLGLDVDKVSVSVNSGDSGQFNEGSDGRQSGSDSKGGNNFPQLADSAAMPELLNLDHWIA